MPASVIQLAGAEEFFPAFELQPLSEDEALKPTPTFNDLQPGALRMIEQEMNAAISLAQRGGYFAARSRLIGCLRQIARLRDAQADVDTHCVALSDALLALEEADDFDDQGPRCEADTLASNYIAGHKTPVLKDAPTSSAVRARRAYYLFVRQKLVEAAGAEKMSAEVLYALGRVERELTLRASTESRRRGPREIPLFEAAVAVNPRNHVAANELGVSLARNGDLRRSRIALAHSASIKSTQEVLINLEYVSQQLGDVITAGRIRQQMVTMQGAPRNMPDASFVSKSEFERIPVPAVENIQSQSARKLPSAVRASATLPQQVNPQFAPNFAPMKRNNRALGQPIERAAHEWFW